MFEISDMDEKFDHGAKIRVIGVGGGGGNAVNTMIRAGLTGVEYIVANTDTQALNASLAPTKIQLGHEITKGLGAGANPEVGRKAALDEYEKLNDLLIGADMVFITAGMGGGTGTGAAPVIAKLCKELGALTVGVVTKPFLFEGKRRFRQADEGITTLEENVDSLITIPNQRLLYLAGENLSLVDTFKKADEVLLNAVRGISDLINNTGHINCDFADISTVMANKGLSLMGTGLCSGPDRAIKSATEAISSPLLEDISIDGATGIIINITGSESLSMHETNEAVTLIMEAADEDAEIIFGTVIDKDMGDDIKVTVIATGLGGLERVTTNSLNAGLKTKKAAPTERVAPVMTEQNMNHRQPIREKRQPVEPQREMRQPVEPQRETYTPPRQPIPNITAPMRERDMREREVRGEREEIPAVKKENISELEKTIQDVSVRYKNREEILSNPTPRTNSKPQELDDTHLNDFKEPTVSNRTKSIAEKLGFINFDEEELDRPSYMRNEEIRTHVEGNEHQNVVDPESIR